MRSHVPVAYDRDSRCFAKVCTMVVWYHGTRRPRFRNSYHFHPDTSQRLPLPTRTRKVATTLTRLTPGQPGTRTTTVVEHCSPASRRLCVALMCWLTAQSASLRRDARGMCADGSTERQCFGHKRLRCRRDHLLLQAVSHSSATLPVLIEQEWA